MDDITRAEPSAPTPENYEGRLAPDQRQSFENALKRQYMKRVLFPFVLFFCFTVWEAMRLWRGHIDSEWLLHISLNIAPLLLGSLIALWIERIQRPRVPRLNHMRRELREGAVAQGEGELVWHEHAYTPVLSGRGLFAIDTTLSDLLPGLYRFFYLPETGLLVAAEPLGEPLPHRDLLLTLAHSQGFSAATLAANRAGEARMEQAEALDITALMGILLSIFAAVFLIMLMLAAFALTGPVSLLSAENGFDTPVLTFVLVILVVVIPMGIALPALRGRRIPKLNLSGLLEKRRVLAVEGMARKSVRDADYLPVYTIEVGGRQFTVQKATYLALDTSIPYRVYYLPRGNRMQSMEPLASEAAPAAV